MIELATIDWVIIGAFLLLSLAIGIYFNKRAGSSLSDFFLSGRNLPWYIAGISMVATTFAADTPLLVTELVAENGISGNWLWWNMLIGGMLATFFFAKLWRRANILTELELMEKRYSGKPAAFLRAFKSVYLGVFLNVVVIAWVNVALMTILQVFFGIDESELLWYIFGAMLVTAIYSTISGLWGVTITDALQFIIAMTGCIILAVIVINSDKVGGIDGLKEKLPEWRFSFFPTSDTGSTGAGTLSITIGAFLAYFAVQWWSAWYPGAEPGGGGYISQRMMSAKDERSSLLATLFFQVAHYCLRPWPWILVALATLILYPELPPAEAKNGFVFAMRDYLPAGLKGLLLVAFLGAYMSTISTQLNWGASFLSNDLYKRFINPESRFSSKEKAERHYVLLARVFTIVIMVIALGVTSITDTIKGAALFLIECGAGVGLVLILRWYWWRINAWSEITATIAPLIIYSTSKFGFDQQFPNSFFITVGGSTVCWLVVTFLTKPTDNDTLLAFYKQVRPGGWWKTVRSKANIKDKGENMLKLVISWLSAISMTYSLLFSIGYLIFKEYVALMQWGSIALISALILYFSMASKGQKTGKTTSESA